MQKIVLDYDIVTDEGVLLLSKGQEITLTEELKNKLNTFGMLEKILENKTPQILSEDIELKCTEDYETEADKKRQEPELLETELKKSSCLVESIVYECKAKKWYHRFKTLSSYVDWIYTHSINTALISCMIGVKLGYQDERLYDLGIGALLHDIGMIKIPKKILNKSSELSYRELNIVRNHCQLGYIILKETEVSEISKSIILQHHEKNDGTGYPKGLKSKDIIEEAKIVSIAEFFDTATTQRPYKIARPASEVLNEMNLKADVYDNRIVKILQSHILI